ncbi:hypothetical protein B7463_g9946, partial [Scytalidium lignicola]
MVFTPPSWVPDFPFELPDSISISEFVHTETYGRRPYKYSRNPFTCGLTGKTYTNAETSENIEYVARGLAKEVGWSPNDGTEWDKVVCVFSLNTIDYMPLLYSVHRLSGIVSPANAVYSASELEYQLKSSKAKALVTCIPLLETAIEAAKAAGIPPNRIFILEMAKQFSGDKLVPFKSVTELMEVGRKLPELEPLRWERGRGRKQTAYLSYSSGTSGFPKGVMISHYNVIANILQFATYDTPFRSKKAENKRAEVSLALLPFSHIYGLSVIGSQGPYQGDELVVLPKFEMKSFLTTIATFKANNLFIVPPIIIAMLNNKSLLTEFDLSNVTGILSGAAPLGEETIRDLQMQFPSWIIRQGYGLTELSPTVTIGNQLDIWGASCGCLLPRSKAKLINMEGVELTGYDEPGELVVQSPSLCLGYFENDKANEETFITDTDGTRWMRTGDEAVFRKAPSGHEHIFITDRIKELIKVKGIQVAPAELEAHILTHPSVADVAVIAVPDHDAGEVPKAFIVKASSVGLEENDRMVARVIARHVEKHKARHKWLRGGIEFVDVIPKSPSGKILRRLLRDQDRAARKASGAKL